MKTSAESGPIASVIFNSQNTSYDLIEPGAWKVTKSAEWTGYGKARITFEVATRTLNEEPKPKDVILVLDKSGSMEGDKLNQVKQDATELTNMLLDDPDNQIALISFETNAEILTDFTDRKDWVNTLIHNTFIGDSTNYSAAYSAVNSILANYAPSNDRSLIILFLTDGLPDVSATGVVEYNILKANHPEATVHGIQYEMGEKILKPIIDVSDYQHIANINTLSNALYQSAFSTKQYDNFTITDYINDSFWTIVNRQAISVSTGSVSLSYDDTTPKVVWNMGGVFRSGLTARMTIDVDLRSEYLDDLEQLLPTNKRTTITTSIDGDNENIDETISPILKDAYSVSYSANAPDGCSFVGELPELSMHSVFSAVELPDIEISCSEYNFAGWRVEGLDLQMINNDYFLMPVGNVVLTGTWGKPSISKSTEGSIHTRAEAVFDTGLNVNVKMRTLSGETEIDTQYTSEEKNNIITAFVHTETLPTGIDFTDENHIFSSDDSPVKIYGWFDNGTIYYYSDADDLYLNEDASQMFFALNTLANIDSLKNVHTSRTTNMNSMFCTYFSSITDMEPFRYWDVSNVTDLGSFFDTLNGPDVTNVDAFEDWNVSKVTDLSWFFNGFGGVTDLQAFAKWNTSNVTTMRGTFWGLRDLTSLSGMENWKTSKVENMASMFEKSTNNLTNLDPLASWNVSNVKYFTYMFYSEEGGWYDREQNYGFSDISALAGWNVQSALYFNGMFYGMNNLSDISALSGWRPTAPKATAAMFYLADITTTDPFKDWNMSQIESIEYMFYGNPHLTHVANVDEETGEITGGVSGWDTSKCKTMDGVFSMNTSLSDLRGLRNWDTSQVTTMSYLFAGTLITDVDELSGWDVSKVEIAYGTFRESQLSNIDGLSGWVTSSLTDVRYMFDSTKITNIGVKIGVDSETGKAIIEGGLGNWDMSHVATMDGMFWGAKQLRDIDGASNWNLGNVTSMSGTFYEAYRLDSIEGARNWNVSNVTNMGWLFDTVRATSLEPLSEWNVSNVTNMKHLFSTMTEITNLHGLENWNVSNVTDMMCMFDNTKKLTNIDAISGWDVSNVTQMNWTFRASAIGDVNALASWTPVKLSNINNMFYEAPNLTDISGISGWFNNAENPTLKNMESTFSKTPLTNLNALSNWKTQNVTNMKNTFNGMASLTDISGIAGWDTAKVTNLEGTFSGTALEDLDDLENWQTNSVVTMKDTFSNMTSLTDISGIAGWNTAKVTTVESIFSGDTGLEDADDLTVLNGWNTTKMTTFTDAFKDIPDTALRPTWYSE